MKLIGIADTTFATYNMARSVIDELKKTGTGFKIHIYLSENFLNDKHISEGCL